MAHREHRVGRQLQVKSKLLTDDLRTKERGAHPTRVESERVQRQQEVLRRRAETLDRHQYYGMLPGGIRVLVSVAEVQAQDQHDRRALETLLAPAHPPLD